MTVLLAFSATICWTKLELPDLLPRTGHGAILKSKKNKENGKEVVLVFGGGDNDGKFYDDVVELPIN